MFRKNRASQWLSGQESACCAGDPGSIPGSGRSPGGGHGNPPQYFCQENPMDRGAWWAAVHRVARQLHTAKVSGHSTAHLYKEDFKFPSGSSGKEPACNPGDTGDMSLIPGSGRPSRGGCGNPLQYSCLENPMDRGACRAIAHGVTRGQTRLKWLRMYA